MPSFDAHSWEGWEGWEVEGSGKTEEALRETGSIQATLVGSCLQLASKVWMRSRGFLRAVCRRRRQGRQSGFIVEGIGWVVSLLRGGQLHTCSGAFERQGRLA